MTWLIDHKRVAIPYLGIPIAAFLAIRTLTASFPWELLFLFSVLLYFGGRGVHHWSVPDGSRPWLSKLRGMLCFVLPFVPMLLLLYFSTGLMSGPVSVLIMWLTFSFQFVGASIPYLTVWTVLAAAALFALLKFPLRRSFEFSLLAAASVFYVVGSYLLFQTYYELPLSYALDDIAAQKGVEFLPHEEDFGTPRQIYIDPQEKFLYVGLHSTRMFNTKKSGIARYRVEDLKIDRFYPLSWTARHFVVDSRDESVYVSSDGNDSIVQLSGELEYQRTLPGTWVDLIDGIVPVDDDALAIRVEVPVVDPALSYLYRSGAPLRRIEMPPDRFLTNIYVAMNSDLQRSRVMILMTGNDLSVVRIVDADGQWLQDVETRGQNWEIYHSEAHDKLFLPSLTMNRMYVIDPDDFSVSIQKVPRAIREVVDYRDGILLLGDYIRGKMHFYDPRSEQITATLLVGRKPEGIGVGPVSGRIYIVSEDGLSIYDPTNL